MKEVEGIWKRVAIDKGELLWRVKMSREVFRVSSEI